MSRPWMPLYVADYLADTAHLRALQSGAYMHLIMHYWRSGSLPDDDAQLSAIARMTDREWAANKSLIQSFFYDGWKHKRIEAELAKSADISSKRRLAAQQMHRNSSANADQMHTHPQPHPQSKKDSNGVNGNSGQKGKPAHGRRTKDGRRLWLDRGTVEWNEYAKDYRQAHGGVDPPVQWDGAGTWFNLAGEH